MQKQTKDPEKLKRAVIKEEFVAITNNFVDAVILNQFLYWTERVKDLGELIEEEKKRESSSNIEANIYNDDSFEHGWFYKSAKQLNEETMLGMGNSAINKHIKTLVDKGFVKRRRNEKYKWDRTWQYRVDINKVAIEVEKAGYTMQGYRFLQTQKNSQGDTKKENAFSEKENGDAKKINRRSINANQNAVKHHRNAYNNETIPEITTETTPETTSENKQKKKKTFLPPDFVVSDRVKKWAEKKGYKNLEEHLEAFKLTCTAKGYKYLDWDSAFMNAIRNNWARIGDKADDKYKEYGL